MVGRVGKQCRKRWNNHLRSHIKKDVLTDDEERQLIQAHERLGNRRPKIAKYIPGRAENSIKNHWNATKRRQISRRKIKKVKGDRRQSTLLEDYIIKKYFSNGSTSTNSNSSITTTIANPSNVGTPLPIDHCQPMNPAEGTSENTYSFNIDENYNHPTIFFTSLEILQTTNSQQPAVEYVENDLFHSAPNPMGNKFFHSEIQIKSWNLILTFKAWRLKLHRFILMSCTLHINGMETMLEA
ncbi:transcription factor MYB64-like [Olea europaea var. sylvestris]|uniref:transcription factor MYB64-like n=1 Tax=Olea europaea var. sylvestris TaxID=158386 RepID=UPI000C1D3DD2|nr:transcription factor MYB64-like [Olea europaea var. sylvestris]